MKNGFHFKICPQRQRGNLARLRERVVANLRQLEADWADRTGSRIENGLLPEAVREGMANAGDEAVPEAYEDLVRDYFEALSRGTR